MGLTFPEDYSACIMLLGPDDIIRDLLIHCGLQKYHIDEKSSKKSISVAIRFYWLIKFLKKVIGKGVRKIKK
jgi:hypothetical protein